MKIYKKGDVSIEELIQGIIVLIVTVLLIAFIFAPEKTIKTIKSIGRGVDERIDLGQEPIAAENFNALPETEQTLNRFAQSLSGLPIPSERPCWTTLPEIILRQDESAHISFSDSNNDRNADVFVEAKKGSALLTGSQGNLRVQASNAMSCLVNSYNFIQCTTSQQNCQNRIGISPSFPISQNFYRNNGLIVIRYRWDAYNNINGVPTCFIRIQEDSYNPGENSPQAVAFNPEAVKINDAVLEFIQNRWWPLSDQVLASIPRC